MSPLSAALTPLITLDINDPGMTALTTVAIISRRAHSDDLAIGRQEDRFANAISSCRPVDVGAKLLPIDRIKRKHSNLPAFTPIAVITRRTDRDLRAVRRKRH